MRIAQMGSRPSFIRVIPYPNEGHRLQFVEREREDVSTDDAGELRSEVNFDADRHFQHADDREIKIKQREQIIGFEFVQKHLQPP
jgi:hypothetical protein